MAFVLKSTDIREIKHYSPAYPCTAIMLHAIRESVPWAMGKAEASPASPMLNHKCQWNRKPLVGAGAHDRKPGSDGSYGFFFFKEKISVSMPKEMGAKTVSTEICLFNFIQIYSWELSEAFLENTCRG